MSPNDQQDPPLCQSDSSFPLIAHANTIRGKIHRVRFRQDNNEVFFTEHISEIPPEDVANIWYSKKEYLAMKRDMIQTVKTIMKQTAIAEDSDQATARGLEYRTKIGAQIRQQRRMSSQKVVLNEQLRQSIEGDANEDLLARIYHKECRLSRNSALTIACKDAAFVMVFQEEEPIDSSDLKHDLKRHGSLSVFHKLLKHSVFRRHFPAPLEATGRRARISGIAA